MDKIDILLATYNGEKYIEEQLLSLQNQTYSDFTVYISDDYSTDSTFEILTNFVKKDSRFKLVPRKKCGGACNNFLYLLSFSKGDFIMFCDQDDQWDRDKIRYSYMSLKQNTIKEDIPLLAYSDLKVVDQDLNTIDNSYFHYQCIQPNHTFKKLLTQNCVTGCTMIFNKALKELTLKTKLNYDDIIMHDWWIAIICSFFGEVYLLDRVLINYRQHGNNSIGAQNSKSLSYILNKITSLSKIHNDIVKTQKQSLLFYKTFHNYNLHDKSNLMDYAYQYGLIQNKNKFQRVCFYIKNHIRKNSFIKTIGWYIGG